MIWRKTSPLARQLLQISEVVCLSAGKVRGRHAAAPHRATSRLRSHHADLVIRPAPPRIRPDRPRLDGELGLDRACEASNFLLANLRARVRREIEDGWTLFVADDDGGIAAMLALHLPKHYLDQLFVAPASQARWLGRQLLAFTRTQMPDEIYPRCVRQNQKAWRWYEREGFVFEKQEIADYGFMMKCYRWKRDAADTKMCDPISPCASPPHALVSDLSRCVRVVEFLWFEYSQPQSFFRASSFPHRPNLLSAGGDHASCACQTCLQEVAPKAKTSAKPATESGPCQSYRHRRCLRGKEGRSIGWQRKHGSDQLGSR